MKPSIPALTINIDNFYIRPLHKSDADSIVKYINDAQIHRNTTNIPYPYSEKDAKTFLTDSPKHWSAGSAYRFGIVINHEVVGCCSLEKINQKDCNAELGYWLGRPFWGQGIMSRVTKAVVAFGFNQLKLHKIIVKHQETNKSSQRIIEKLGFMYEGTERESHLRDGKWCNCRCYSLLESEFKFNSN